MATAVSEPFRVVIKAPAAAGAFDALLHPGDGDAGANRSAVNLYGGNNSIPRLYSGALGWKNPDVWDWKDANGVAQGSAPYASIAASSAHADGTVYSISSAALTTLIEEMRSGAKPNYGFMLRATAGVVAILQSRQAASGKPQLILTLADAKTQVTRDVGADVHLSLSSIGSAGAAQSLSLENAASVWFDLSGIPQRIVAATLKLTVTHNYGGSGAIGVYRVDLDHLQITGPVEQGLAQNYEKDAGLAGNRSVFVVEHFPDATSQTSRGWASNPPNGGGIDTSIVGASDPDSAMQYQPLASSVNALKVRIKAGNHGGTILRRYFYQNGGVEPDELYIRYYLRLANDFNPTDAPGGGKLMAGFDGTYNSANRRRKPDAPGYAGNGGRPSSSGCTGWSIRGGYGPTIPGNEISDAGYRFAYFYSYFPTIHMLNDRYEYGGRVTWRTGSFLQKNRWYCIEMYLKMNSIDTSGGTLAHFGNAIHVGVNQDTAWLYSNAAPTPVTPDTTIISAPHVYYGNKTGYLYPSASWAGRWLTSDAGKDTAVLTSPGVGRNDAQLRVWIDGKLVLNLDNFLMRHIANVQIESVWLDQYVGGTLPDVVDTTLYVAQVVASSQYVGPMRMT